MHVRMKSDLCHAASLWIFALMIAHWYDLRLWCFIEGHADTGMALGVPPNGEVCFAQHQNCTARLCVLLLRAVLIWVTVPTCLRVVCQKQALHPLTTSDTLT